VAVVAHIILTHASHESEGYTYSVPPELVDELSIGMLVEVEFGNGLAQGILADFAETVAIPDGVKPVLRALTPPLLTPGMIATILRYAHRHMIHVHKVLSLYLPAPYIHRILKYGLLHDRSSAETPVISKPELNPPVKLVYTLSQ
jgi:primosomal protein N' (replication factor Y)